MTRTEYMAQLEKYLKKLPHKEFQEAITFFNEYFDEAGPEHEATIIEELGTPKEAASELINNILQRHIQGDEDSIDSNENDKGLNKRHVYTLITLVVCLLFSMFCLFTGTLFGVFGIFGIFFVFLFGAFYLGKNWQEFREAKKTVWLSILAILSLPIAIPAAILLIGLLVLLILLVLVFLLAGLFASIGFFVGGIYFIWEAFTLLSQGLNVFLIGLGFGLSSIGGAVLLYLLTGFFAYWSWTFIKTCFKWILNRGKRA